MNQPSVPVRPPIGGSSRHPQRRHRRRYPQGSANPVYGALDLGTNNCRLLIARPAADGFKVVDAFSRIVRLGQGVAMSGQLAEEAMERTIAALKVCADKIERRRVTVMRSVATQACRSAANCSAFIDRVHSETGLALDVISAEEEARLAVLGCQTLLDRGVKNAIVFDIGGGSTELIWVEVGEDDDVEIKGWTSLPYGVVNLSERYGFGLISPAQFADMAAPVTAALAEFDAAYGLREHLGKGDADLQLLGTSGTVTTLASLELGLAVYDRAKVDGCVVDSAGIRALSRRLAAMENVERGRFGCVGAERADLVVAGCAILDAILAYWPVARLKVADRGIREGVLRGLMRGDGVWA